MQEVFKFPRFPFLVFVHFFFLAARTRNPQPLLLSSVKRHFLSRSCCPFFPAPSFKLKNIEEAEVGKFLEVN